MEKSKKYILASMAGFFTTVFFITYVNEFGLWSIACAALSALPTMICTTKAFAYRQSEEYKTSVEYIEGKLLDLYDLRKNNLITQRVFEEKQEALLQIIK